MEPKPLLVCVVGPTAIGKTALSIELAKAFATEIISADSRQFFKEMSIGTAVPSPEELAAAPHHFIQNLSIEDEYSVGDFERDTLVLLESLFQKHSIVILVGGSGLYVDAVVKGLDTFPEVSSEIRESLVSELEEKGLAHLQQELKEVDPTHFEKVDIQNPHRVIRALEVFRASGQPYSSFLNAPNAKRPFNTLHIGLSADREIVYDRINKRVDLMIEAGLVKEAEALFPHRQLNALQTVGYRELFGHFEGELSLEEAISEIKKNTRRFAKRQGTWFRKNENIHWFDYTTPTEEIVTFVNTKSTQIP
ncbi:tRNA (adenosine(37)-N6)-dimethylallyltransferase MiaA [Aureisphaera galaxeae]|uniref:tRNA (adenosine(37)-N6)-dimethylallyltransferase MiaA n=1 Tax=Aureisphaera galaxeae TaxID=1538023 RepID=UPI0023509BCA|nr:tRNA (adenosine(37)-N6)-dimethylallyltransferase MiaA [Aureisphaera galaxeae]MDC8004960.1 tRNA (adenosine(37)-N6)-dimethylallyltransferase MiaA [Aureisphaera galaxeae]